MRFSLQSLGPKMEAVVERFRRLHPDVAQVLHDIHGIHYRLI
jgi:hypothetical protein